MGLLGKPTILGDPHIYISYIILYIEYIFCNKETYARLCDMKHTYIHFSTDDSTDFKPALWMVYAASLLDLYLILHVRLGARLVRWKTKFSLLHLNRWVILESEFKWITSCNSPPGHQVFWNGFKVFFHFLKISKLTSIFQACFVSRLINGEAKKHLRTRLAPVFLLPRPGDGGFKRSIWQISSKWWWKVREAMGPLISEKKTRLVKYYSIWPRTHVFFFAILVMISLAFA